MSYLIQGASALCALVVSSLLPRRVGCSRQSAMPGQPMRLHEQAQKEASPGKIVVTSRSPWRHISCHTDKNRYDT